jgi:hypothetical protein
MKYFKKDGKLYVQCLDGELELPDNHLEYLQASAKYFEDAIENSKGKNWTTASLPKELDTKIKIDLYLQVLREAVDKWHKEKQNKDYLFVINGLISKADMEISNFLLAKEDKEKYEFLFKGLIAIRDFWQNLPFPSIGSIQGLNCLGKYKNDELEFIYQNLSGKMLHKSVTQENFVGAFKGATLPKQIHWIKSNPKLATLVNVLTGLEPEKSLITKLFKTEKPYNRMAERRAKAKPDKYITDLINKA